MSAEQKTLVLENTTRRDALIAIEQKYQRVWQDEKLFEIDAPAEAGEAAVSNAELHKKHPKYMATMAYPYMNGVLHAGHTFTLSKAEFAVGYERMKGRRALFPMGFHCTGMPIMAAADKLKREIEQFGPNFDQNTEETPEPEEKAAAAAAGKDDPSKFKSQKSKAAAKQGTAKYQYQIMLQLGIPRGDVHKFADPLHWVHFFPPLVQEDCRLLGARVDWRRSFVTTDVNPYHDSFVRWQMNTLKQLGHIKFGRRYTIFSPKDGQPCMDHDRQTGEGVGPQEYVGIKIRVTEFPSAAQSVIDSVSHMLGADAKVYLVAATLRPETMYGQTCCFVSPTITYGLFEAGPGEWYICTERAFRNMAYQDLTPRRGHFSPVADIPGASLIGAKISAPLAQFETLRVLPMATILPTKGTGVVTCVPSDSPDDFVTTRELRKKADFYNIDAAWIPEEIPACIETPTYGTKTAEKLVEELKIQSPKDKEKLAEAKERSYKEGFYKGTMVVGKYKGEPVADAKPKVRDDLVAAGQAFLYSEPEGLVVSRSGDVAVVSLQDQWFNNYGEDAWRAATETALARLETFGPETRNAFEAVLAWLKNWALSRTYGLGSHIPWDPQYLVESLSDSTIYMSYYTVAHLLHSDFYGKEIGSLGIKPHELDDAAWDYVFFRSNEVSSDCSISLDKLDRMRAEFRYFYPLDLRVSGKDLLPNHLTFFLYCHTAIFEEQFWPKGVRANGHLLLNNEKMSKSTGNFMTLRDMVKKFGSDASRIALADAGDTFEDANFDEANANAAILRLSTLKEWAEHVLAHPEELRTGAADNFFDKAFAAELDALVAATDKAYELAQYKAALKSGLFDLQNARDYYRDTCNSLGLGMHRDLVLRYIEVQALLLQPVAPHFAEWVWREALGRKGSAQDAPFPQPAAPVDRGVLDAVAYVRDVSRGIREAEGALLKKKKGGQAFDPKAPAKLTLYVAADFPAWQTAYLDLVKETLDTDDFRNMTGAFKQRASKLGDPKRGLQFVSHLRGEILAGNEPADEILNRKLRFSEVAAAKAARTVFEKSAQASNVVALDIVEVKDGKGVSALSGEAVEVPSSRAVQDAAPGNPGLVLANEAAA